MELTQEEKMMLTAKQQILLYKPTHDRSRCRKCVYECYCSKDKDYEGKCPDYKRDAPDGGYYG